MVNSNAALPPLIKTRRLPHLVLLVRLFTRFLALNLRLYFVCFYVVVVVVVVICFCAFIYCSFLFYIFLSLQPHLSYIAFLVIVL